MTSTEQVTGISVILPCLNEEASIGQVINMARRGVRKLGLKEEIIVVDNGSIDHSAEIAREKGAHVVTEPHKGYGSALRTGFNHATHKILVMSDSDLSYDLEKLDTIVQPLLDGQADFVIGNRMRNIKPGAMPKLHRYLGNPLLSFLLRAMFFNSSVHDAHCGLRAITRSAYSKLGCVTTGMEFASEMVIRAIHRHLHIVERNVIYHPRIGKSKLHSFRDGWRHLRFMILHGPTMLLLIPGIFTWLLGLVISLPLAFGPIIINGRSVDIHCMIIGGVLNIISLQVITIGLLAKAYAHLSGLYHDAIIAWLYRWLTFEKAFFISLPLVLIGFIITVIVTIQWIKTGFGPLNEQRLLFLSLLCLVNGVQIGAASYLFSIMALPRHIDSPSPTARDTGITNI